jgi:methionine-S-sulfoxide reductase
MKKILFFSFLLIFFIIMINVFSPSNNNNSQTSSDQFIEAKAEYQQLSGQENLVPATFAGGCFWCLEGPLESIDGVKGVILGYMGGDVIDPTYQQVTGGTTGHREVAQALYDPDVTDYRDLVDIYWKFIDPTDAGGQFADRGSQYRIGIYYHNDEQKKIAEEYILEMTDSGKYEKPIVVEILPASDFYLAEDYHQNYYKKQSQNYKGYYKGSGREAYVESNK